VTLKTAKLATLRSARELGLFSAVRQSRWRRRRLLILCYHGLSLEDEHVWNPVLYVEPATFRERMKTLRDSGYNVLPLGEGLRRLSEGTLPPRSVAITFDDGNYNFYALAWPILREFGFPATVYLSTYYCRRQMPVFDVAIAYLTWKGRNRTLDTRGLLPRGGERRIGEDDSYVLFKALHQSVSERGLPAAAKDELAADLASRLGLKYEELRDRRMFHLMTPVEVEEVARNQIAIELHTHRHRTPRDRILFLKEIEDNQREIAAITGRQPSHFCYPRGDYIPEFFAWLRECRIRSATTCESGLASARDEWMRLPRLLDTNSLPAIEFEGWLTGFCAKLPRRKETNCEGNHRGHHMLAG
jgi:peptidoglycan/xylan/chitin deacetylase (PgdA/CDA1 family)